MLGMLPTALRRMTIGAYHPVYHCLQSSPVMSLALLQYPCPSPQSGPLVGGPLSPDAPQAISENHFRKICPNTTILLTEDLAQDLNGATLLQKLKIWTEKLGSIEDRCVEIPHGTPQVFDFLYAPRTSKQSANSFDILLRQSFWKQRSTEPMASTITIADHQTLRLVIPYICDLRGK